MADPPVRFGEYFPPGYGKFAMRWDCQDTDYPAVCTFGFRNVGNLTAVEATAALQPIWYNVNRPSHIGPMSNQWTNDSTYCLLQHVGYQTSYESALSTVGTETDEVPAAGSTVVVRKRTARAGKRYRGRLSWPPFMVLESNVDSGGRMNSGEVADLQTKFTAALNAMTTASLPMVLIHTRFTVDEEPIPTIVDALEVQPVMGFQRKRQRR